MHITVRLGDPLWRTVGQRRLELELAEGQSAADALAAAGLHETRFLPENGPRGLPVNLFVNRRKIPWELAGQTVLHDGDQVAAFLLVVGG